MGSVLGLVVILGLAFLWLGRPFLHGYRGTERVATEGATAMMMTELQLMQDMTDSQRLLFQAQMAQHRKSVSVAALLAFFGFFGMHRFYLGQIGLGVLMLASWVVFVAPFWAVIDLCRIKTLVEGVNSAKAMEIALMVKMLTPGGNGGTAPPTVGETSPRPVVTSPRPVVTSPRPVVSGPKTAREQLEELRRKTRS